MIHKKLLSLLVLLMTAASGAWADNTVYTSGQSVRIVDLKVGDIILPGATVTRDGMSTPSIQRLKFRRCTTEWVEMTESLPVTFDENAGLGDYHVGGKPLQPIDENGNVGNAWQVAVLTLEPFGYIATLDGITYRDPNAPVISEDGTEAEFEMPGNDATAEFDLVRDMNDATYPVAFSGLPEPAADTGVAKIVVKYNSSTQKFEFLNAITIALIDPLAATDAQNIIEADGITIKVLVGAENGQGAIDYDQDNPITLEAFLADTQPGYYWIKAVPTDETTSPYIGTVYSSELLLIKGYEVTVPAGEYITYYRDEPLYADPVSSADAQLYTITSVSTTDGTATLSDAIATAPSSTPLLVYNAGNTDATFLLIPADAEPNLALTVAPEFIGTLTGTTIAASTEGTTNYALNGKAFVFVKSALEIGANKAWLSISNSNARTINLVSSDSETTGIEAIDNGQLTIDNWYDLNGRRLQGKPTRKGIYIQNGRKVVVK